MAESPVVIILRGPPGVGKTTVAALLRDRLAPAVRLSIDTLRYLVHPRPLEQRYLRAAKIAAARLAADYAASGISSVIESVFLDPGVLAEAVEVLRRSNVAHRVFSLRAALPEMQRRDALRRDVDRQGTRVAEIHGEFAWVGDVIDTDDRVPEEIVEEIVSRVRDRDAWTTGTRSAAKKLCVFLRHGACDHEPARYRSPQHVTLTEAGAAGVSATAATLVRFGAERMVASPYRRSVETAAIVSRMTGVDYEIDERLRERHFASIEGRTYDDLRQAGILDVDLLLTRSENVHLAGEETVHEAQARAATALQEIMCGHARRVIVVSHGGPHMWLLSTYLGLPLDRRHSLPLAAAHFSVFEFHDDGRFSTVRAVNSCAWDETILQ